MRILLVEDEDILANFLKMQLEESGHDVLWVANGRDAEATILEKTFDVVILDIIIPFKNGIEVCRSVREKGITTHIIILSSQNTEASKIEGLEAGADDYLTKPFSYPELLARLHALHRRPKQIIGDVISFGDVTVNEKLHLAYYNDTPLKLRTKEFTLLLYLMRNTGRIVSRDELFENIWGVYSYNASNRVDVCIKEIRNKTYKDFIKTIHGTGYMIGDQPAHVE